MIKELSTKLWPGDSESIRVQAGEERGLCAVRGGLWTETDGALCVGASGGVCTGGRSQRLVCVCVCL